MTAGVHRASSIKVAEAAKVIENTQRDLNIALMNELALIFHRIGIDTLEVLQAAGTKWNFLPFRPGLVGGHCIGVDPYYLTHKAEMLGYHPQVILAGRRINDGMGKYVAEQTVKHLIAGGWQVKGAHVDRARAHVQGGLPGPAQLARDRRHPRARSPTAPTCTCTIRSPTPTEARHEYGVELDAVGAAAARPRRSSRRWRTASSRRARSTTISAKLAPGGLVRRREEPVRRRGAARRAASTVWRL